jgi:hypothetical protein
MIFSSESSCSVDDLQKLRSSGTAVEYSHMGVNQGRKVPMNAQLSI